MQPGTFLIVNSGNTSLSQGIPNMFTGSEENHFEALDTPGETAFQKVQKASLKPSVHKKLCILLKTAHLKTEL